MFVNSGAGLTASRGYCRSSSRAPQRCGRGGRGEATPSLTPVRARFWGNECAPDSPYPQAKGARPIG
jgi:hypothetical protein